MGKKNKPGSNTGYKRLSGASGTGFAWERIANRLGAAPPPPPGLSAASEEHSLPTAHSTTPSTEPDKTDDLAELYERNGRPIAKYLTARLRDQGQAQKMAEEAWLRLHRMDYPDQLDQARRFLLQSAIDSGAGDRPVNFEFLNLLISNPEPGEHAQEMSGESSLNTTEEAQHQLEQALDELPSKCRQAFVLHRVHKMPYPLIAEQLGVGSEVVEKFILQALRHFRCRIPDLTVTYR